MSFRRKTKKKEERLVERWLIIIITITKIIIVIKSIIINIIAKIIAAMSHKKEHLRHFPVVRKVEPMGVGKQARKAHKQQLSICYGP